MKSHESSARAENAAQPATTPAGAEPRAEAAGVAGLPGAGAAGRAADGEGTGIGPVMLPVTLPLDVLDEPAVPPSSRPIDVIVRARPVAPGGNPADVVVNVERVLTPGAGEALGGRERPAGEGRAGEPVVGQAPGAAPVPSSAPPLTRDEFAARVERALVNIYHGDEADRRVAYEVRRGRLPEGLTGRTYTTVFSYESVMAGPGLAASPNMLTAPGRVLTIDFGAGGPARREVPVATTTIENEAWHLRALAPNAFVRSDFAEFSWFGISNLSNTCAVPAFAADEDGRPRRGVRLLLSYDAGRPIEVNPATLAYVTPVGRATNYHAAVGSLFGPMIMTSGHPAYDPDFDRGRPRLVYTNLVPRVTSFFTVNTPVSADLYLVTWDGGPGGPTPPLRVCAGGKPVVLDQASAHQICLTDNYVVVMQATLVLDTASLLKPLSPLVRRHLARTFGGRVPRALDRLDDAMNARLRAAIQPSYTDLYFVAKAALRKALGAGAGSVEATRVRLDWEATHAVVDRDDAGGRVTLYCQHNVGADPTDQIEPGDELLGGGTANRELEGMFSASTDLNQVRKYVIDAARGEVLSVASFPDPASDDDFPFGLNLLPPTQVLPYRAGGGGEAFDQLACTRSWDCTFWVSGGWTPPTSLRRVFDRYRAARRGAGPGGGDKRLVPYDAYLERVADVRNAARFFRLGRSLDVESSYAFEPGVLMGSPTFVPRAGARSVRDGYLVAGVWRHDDPAMEIWVWDAGGDFAAGPLCVLGAPPGEPGLRPGFPLHGCWVEDGAAEAWEPPAYRVPAVEVPSALKWAEALTAGVTAAGRLVQQLLMP